jgi:nicotinic acid phosphoribosyltransferase
MRVKYNPAANNEGELTDAINYSMDSDLYELRTMTYLPETNEMLVAYRVAAHRR